MGRGKVALAAVCGLGLWTTAWGQWTFEAGIHATESWDNNVFLAGRGPLSDEKSLVSRVGVELAGRRPFAGRHELFIAYAPEVEVFHSAHEEDHVDHIVRVNMQGTADAWTYTLNNSVKYVDGDEENPVFVDDGGNAFSPFLAGIQLRDRSEAVVWRQGWKAQRTFGSLLVEPVYRLYVHDFETNTVAQTGRVNYVDRWEAKAGVNVGWQVPGRDFYLLAAYHGGHQHQDPKMGSAFCYTNNLHRFLVGARGRLTDWLEMDFLLGPDYREFTETTPAAFGDGQTFLYIHGNATASLTEKTKLTFLFKRYLQPSYTGGSAYEDITYRASLSHAFNAEWSTAATLYVNEGDWPAGTINRRERLIQPSVSVTWRPRPRLSLFAKYSFDETEDLAQTPGVAEYDRTVMSIGLNYRF